MISFRYHIISIAAVFLALATGIALGAGLLDDAGTTLSHSDDAADPAATSFDNGYVKATAGSLAKGVLDSASVVILTTPGASTRQLNAVKARIESSGGSITGVGELTTKALDAGNRQFAGSISTQAADDAGVSIDGDGFTALGQALAQAIGVKPGAAISGKSAALGAALLEAKLLSWQQKPTKTANVLLVVTGGSRAGESGPVLGTLVRATDAAGLATTVTGPAISSRGSGYLAAVRDNSENVSTVDVLDSPAGPVAAVLALAQKVKGGHGEYGTSRSQDGALPSAK